MNIIGDVLIKADEDVKESIGDIKESTSILYFCNDYQNEYENVKKLNNQNIERIIFISSKNEKVDSKTIAVKQLNKKLIKKFEDNIFIVIKLNDEYSYVKNIINNIKKMTIGECNNDCKELKVKILIINSNSKYYNDVINSLKALSIHTKRERYEYIYDIVCDYLDSQFIENNYCNFCNNQCVTNRKVIDKGHKTMGCCYAFDYAGLFSLRLTKNVRLCEYMQNNTCATKNIGCKLFTCRNLQSQNIKFDIHEILLLDCFFNKKQHLVMTSNYFRSREELLNKLLEESKMPYFLYYLFAMYKIKS